MDKPDWQILLKLKTDGIGLLLPDLQKMRMLANDLKGRFHQEIAQGRIDDALGTAKTMFALSRHMGEHPTLIGDLVAIAMAQITIGPLEEMLEQPGCPNLYWALANLPRPFIDLRQGVQADRMMLTDLFALIDERVPMSDAQVRQAVAPIRRMVKDLNIRWDEHAWLNELTNEEERLRAARQRLIEAGLAEDKVKQFSAQQVTLLNEKLEFSVWDDESRKAMNLPYWQAAPILSAASPRKSSKYSPFRWIEKSYDKVKMAQTRLDQRLALLRCVEALRLYAAEHEGKLPDKLSDIDVPLPDDPFTGKPFVYQLEGETSHLRGTPPRALKENPAFNIHYEITIRK
jgi:hypothetical protein